KSSTSSTPCSSRSRNSGRGRRWVSRRSAWHSPRGRPEGDGRWMGMTPLRYPRGPRAALSGAAGLGCRLDDDRGDGALIGTVEDRFDIVAVRIEHETGIVTGVIVAFARWAVIGAAGGQSGLVEGVDRLPVPGLEGQMNVARNGPGIGGIDE